MAMLQIRDLTITITSNNGSGHLCNGIDLDIQRGESIALIGESGCGKTMTALAIMGLLPSGIEAEGRIIFKGNNILGSSKSMIRQIRRKEISMIFEQPTTCLNPCFSVGAQLAEVVRTGLKISREKARKVAMKWIEKVGIVPHEKRYIQYPHQLSGGMQQRIMIAAALAVRPSLLIADEPTTALDVTVQAQIMSLIRDLISRSETSLLLITHDLALASEMCEKSVVMYSGEIVEHGLTKEITRNPRHPYTQALLEALNPGGFRP